MKYERDLKLLRSLAFDTLIGRVYKIIDKNPPYFL